MKRIAFWGCYPFWEKGIDDQIQENIEHICQMEPRVEAWFSGRQDLTENKAADVVMDYKNAHPEQDVSIVRVSSPFDNVFPKKEDRFKIVSYREISVPEKIWSKEADTKKVRTFSSRYRWMLSQCNILFSYNYNELPDFSTRQILRIRNMFPGLEIIRLFKPETVAKIGEEIQDLPEMKRSILQEAQADIPMKKIAENHGISYSRVGQILEYAGLEVLKKAAGLQKS